MGLEEVARNLDPRSLPSIDLLNGHLAQIPQGSVRVLTGVPFYRMLAEFRLDAI